MAKEHPDDKLTMKQKKFVKELVKTQNGAEAAIRSYDTKDRRVASTIAHENINRPHVREYLQQELRKAGFTLPEILQDMKESVKAGLGQKATNADAIRTLDMVLKLHGAYPNQKKMVEKVSIALDIKEKEQPELAKMVLEMLSDTTSVIEGELEE